MSITGPITTIRRTVLNNPAGEITMNLGITGPHYVIGAACAAGNASLIQAVQMMRLDEVDMAIAGGISESIGSFGIFASFKSQGAWQRPMIRDGHPGRSILTETASLYQKVPAFTPWNILKKHSKEGLTYMERLSVMP